jgi:hypothetical protein
LPGDARRLEDCTIERPICGQHQQLDVVVGLFDGFGHGHGRE